MGKMRYLIAITETDDGYEGLLVCENGIVLKREQGRVGTEIFRSLLSVFPAREGAACISGKGFATDAPKKWKIRLESRGEAMVRGVFGEENGAVLLIGNRVYAAAKEGEKVREVQDIPFGKARMAEEAIRTGLHADCSWLRHALEEATGLPKADIPAYLASLPAEKRLGMARLIRKGAAEGDVVSLALVKEALHAYSEALRSVSPETKMPLVILGPPKMDMPVIRKGIETFSPGAFTFRENAMPPIYGSVCGAAAAYKIPPDEGFRRRFLETYFLYI